MLGHGGIVGDDAAFSDVLAAHFELRLEQDDRLGAGLRQGEGRIDDLEDRHKAHVGDDQVDRIRDQRGGQVAAVDAFQRDDARIVAQPLGQLVMADIDGIDFCGAALEQHLGEPAGRRAEIEADLA